MPWLDTGSRYSSCCGKEICSACVLEVAIRDQHEQKCAFCRTPAAKLDEENIKRLKKRIEAGDANAMFNLGVCYSNGSFGMPQNHDKALELYHRAGELGYSAAHNNIGNAYHFGEVVERDEKKADHYHELAAMQGDEYSRHNLGNSEFRAGNWDRAIKHYTISAEVGYNGSVKMIQKLYTDGDATKEDYSKALRTYQTYLDEIKSKQRDAAAAANDEYKYY